ncbi:MAG: hypothetical protein ABWY16_00795 [Pedobacter sp.]|uniref:hypothetical protein n=1 Tax=Pedobacter sp. TaxID=1411316 RepID=UPI0033964B24
MKKFILVCAILFIVNAGCKKMNLDGGGACGCSPVQVGLQLNLVVKNVAGDDLLDDKVAGAYTRDKIELYRKDSGGKTVPILFAIRPPFSYGDEKFKFSELSLLDSSYVPNSAGSVLYLKLGDKTYELTLQAKPNTYTIEKVLIDQKEAEKDNGTVAKYSTIFYLTQ